MKLKKLLMNWRVIILLVFILFALISIKPGLWVEGVAIKSVTINSSASDAGIENPSPKLAPLTKERVISINGEAISSVEQYYSFVGGLGENRTVHLETNQEIYSLLTKKNVEGGVDLGLKVDEAPSSNIRKGLDLEGGTRVLLKPASKISDDDMEIIISNLKERLNVYGLGDVVVRTATDLAGEDFILIEMAGVTEEEVKDLLAKQGKFEAKIGNETVFLGGKKI